MNAVQCDYCGKFAPNPDDRGHRMEQLLPHGWWRAAAEKVDTPMSSRVSPGIGGEFCSLDCVSGFFAKPHEDT